MEFLLKRELKHHESRHHSISSNQFNCDLCGKTFCSKQASQIHRNRHTREIIYQCDICGKCLADPPAMHYHKLSHAGVKRFPCETCGKRFTRKDKLKRHLVVHTQIKDFVCEICSKAFARKDKLKYHRQIHDRKKTDLTPSGSRSSMFQDKGEVKDHEQKLLDQVLVENLNIDEISKKDSKQANLDIKNLDSKADVPVV